MSNAWIIAPLAIVAATSSQSAAGFDPLNVGNDHIGVVWQTTTGDLKQIDIDLGADVAIDTVLLISTGGATANWDWEVQIRNAANTLVHGSTIDLLAGANLPRSGRGRGLFSLAAPVTGRYVRLFFIAPVSAGIAFSVGRIVIGKRIALARNFRFGAAFGVRDLGAAEFSRWGVLLRTMGAKLRSVGLTFGNVYRDEVEGAVHPLIERLGLTRTVAVVTDPDANADRQNRILFGPMLGDIGTVWARANGFEWSANIVDLEPVA